MSLFAILNAMPLFSVVPPIATVGLIANRVKRHKKESKNPSMMTTFNFYFGCTLGEQLLRQTDNLGRWLFIQLVWYMLK